MLSNTSKIVLAAIVILIVFAGIVTAIIVGGGAYFWQTANHIEVQTNQTAKASAELMRELIMKNYPTAAVENYKIFDEVKSPDSTKSAVLFGLDIEKTKECCSKPTGLFINNQGSLGAKYDSLQGVLDHMYLANAKWQDNKTVQYDLVISDEGSEQTTQKFIVTDNQTNSGYGTTSFSSSAQNDEITEIKFKLALLAVRGVHESFRDPLDKNKFYFVTYMDGPYGIWVYDLTKDKTFQENGNISMTQEGYTLLFNQKLAKFRELKGVGVVENKFVFAETSPDFSLSACASSWSYPNLQYIDLGVSAPTRKQFTLPVDIKKLVDKGTAICQQL